MSVHSWFAQRVDLSREWQSCERVFAEYARWSSPTRANSIADEAPSPGRSLCRLRVLRRLTRSSQRFPPSLSTGTSSLSCAGNRQPERGEREHGVVELFGRSQGLPFRAA